MYGAIGELEVLASLAGQPYGSEGRSFLHSDMVHISLW